MPAPQKIFPWVLFLAVVAGIIIALRTYYLSSPSDTISLPHASSPEIAATTPPTVRPIPGSTSTPSLSAPQAQSEIAPQPTPPQPPKPETPFLIGSAEASPAMDPTTVVDKMRIV